MMATRGENMDRRRSKAQNFRGTFFFSTIHSYTKIYIWAEILLPCSTALRKPYWNLFKSRRDDQSSARNSNSRFSLFGSPKALYPHSINSREVSFNLLLSPQAKGRGKRSKASYHIPSSIILVNKNINPKRYKLGN